jgi:hypothetical protein
MQCLAERRIERRDLATDVVVICLQSARRERVLRPTANRVVADGK